MFCRILCFDTSSTWKSKSFSSNTKTSCLQAALETITKIAIFPRWIFLSTSNIFPFRVPTFALSFCTFPTIVHHLSVTYSFVVSRSNVLKSKDFCKTNTGDSTGILIIDDKFYSFWKQSTPHLLQVLLPARQLKLPKSPYLIISSVATVNISQISPHTWPFTCQVFFVSLAAVHCCFLI